MNVFPSNDLMASRMIGRGMLMPKEVAFWVAYGKNASNEPQYFYSWEKPE